MQQLLILLQRGILNFTSSEEGSKHRDREYVLARVG